MGRIVFCLFISSFSKVVQDYNNSSYLPHKNFPPGWIMGDPFSLAASAAGLITLSSTISKGIYQFCRSIKDASAVARNLTASLSTLDTALELVKKSLVLKEVVPIMDSEHLQP